jgi:hypothetical protein
MSPIGALLQKVVALRRTLGLAISASTESRGYLRFDMKCGTCSLPICAEHQKSARASHVMAANGMGTERNGGAVGLAGNLRRSVGRGGSLAPSMVRMWMVGGGLNTSSREAQFMPPPDHSHSARQRPTNASRADPQPNGGFRRHQTFGLQSGLLLPGGRHTALVAAVTLGFGDAALVFRRCEPDVDSILSFTFWASSRTTMSNRSPTIRTGSTEVLRLATPAVWN